MPPYCRLLLCTSLLGAWALPACAGSAQSAFPVRITLSNPLFSGSAGGARNPAASPGTCSTRSAPAGGGAVVTIACEANEFVSVGRLPGSPFLDPDRDADRYVIQAAAEVATDDPLWYPGTGTVTTLQIRYKNKQADTMEIRINF